MSLTTSCAIVTSPVPSWASSLQLSSNADIDVLRRNFTAVYSFSLFLPTIVKAQGYENNRAQLMTVPPYVVACMACLTTGYLSDSFRTRAFFMIFWNVVDIIGLIVLVSANSNHVKYAGCFFYALGVYPNVPQCMAWNGNNTGGSTKRSIALAVQAMGDNLGGILASFIYLEKDSPEFTQGYCIVIGLLTLSASVSTFMTVYYRRENARRDRDYKKPKEYTAEEKALERGRGAMMVRSSGLLSEALCRSMAKPLRALSNRECDEFLSIVYYCTVLKQVSASWLIPSPMSCETVGIYPCQDQLETVQGFGCRLLSSIQINQCFKLLSTMRSTREMLRSVLIRMLGFCIH